MSGTRVTDRQITPYPQGATGPGGPPGSAIALEYTFSSRTDGKTDPGQLSFNNSNPDLATVIALDSTDMHGHDVSDVLNVMDQADPLTLSGGAVRTVAEPSIKWLSCNITAVDPPAAGTTAYLLHISLIGSGSVPNFVDGNLVVFQAAYAGPPGASGASGPSGPAGAAGPTGPPGVGATGATGPPGAASTQGATGSTGPAGSSGATGPQGDPGPAATQGATGATGSTGGVGPAGATGSQGAAGPSGPTGPQGAIGASGAQGVAGTAGATGVMGGTGPQGVAGASGATGPQGTAGVQGATGTAGPAGPTGPQGPQGTAGTVGATGPQGLTGPQGTSGTAGATGPQGTAGGQGATGNTGPQGTAGGVGATGVGGGVGATGTQGIQGVQGATGAQGTQGPQGATGVAGGAGPQGATGPQGPQGAAGGQGATGIQGTTGPTGPQGTAGGVGATGAGATGATGAQGTAGAVGATGATGPGGPTGAAGLTGATGTADLAYLGGFTGTTAYKDGDVVVQNGVPYLCVMPTSQTPVPWPGYAPAVPYSAQIITDWNDPVAQNTGFYAALGNALNGPAGLNATDYWVGMTIAYSQNEANQFIMRGNSCWLRRKGGGTWFAWSLLAPAGRSAGLPASPLDGTQQILVDSAASTTRQWLMRYSTAFTGTSKWEFLGGVPGVGENQAQQSLLTTLGWQAFSPGINYNIPLAGDYDVQVQVKISTVNATKASIGVAIGAAAPVAGNIVDLTGTGDRWFSAKFTLTGLAASVSIALKYQFDVTPTTPTATNMRIEVTPRRFG